jgi:hypothetical protein
MLNDIYLPEPIYRAWPWLCLGSGVVAAVFGYWLLAVPLAVYAAAVYTMRSY